MSELGGGGHNPISCHKKFMEMVGAVIQLSLAEFAIYYQQSI